MNDYPELSEREKSIIALIREEIKADRKRGKESIYKYIDHVRVEDLPEPLSTIAASKGIEAAIDLAESISGVKIYSPSKGIPSSFPRFKTFSNIIGRELAEKLYNDARGGFIELPSLKKTLSIARERYVKHRYDEGATVNKICADTGLSRRRLFDILKTPDD